MGIKKGTEVTFRVESAAFEGKGIGKIDDIVVFVDNTAPGDLVKARIIKKKKRFLQAKLIEVLEAGPVRIKPKCRHARICGGCTWQHLPYDYQLEIKRQQVEDHMHRIGDLTHLTPETVIGSENPFYYRNKMEYSFGDRRWLTEKEIQSGVEILDKDMAAGLHVPGRFDRILNLEECHLQDPISYQIMDFVRSFALERDISPYNPVRREGFLRNVMVRNSYYLDDLMVNIVTSADDEAIMKELTSALREAFPAITTVVNNVNDTPSPTAVGRYEKNYFGPGYITDKIGDYSFKIHPNAFFQTNTKQAEALYKVAIDFAEIKENELVFDLYCGVGTLTLFASDRARKVVGIEINEVALENARHNAEENNVTNCKFRTGDMKDAFSDALIDEYGVPDVIITDPPRSGMHPDVVQRLCELGAKKLVYVSCNSSTMARDLKELNEVYEITDIQPVDMFPQTYHIETVARLVRRD